MERLNHQDRGRRPEVAENMRPFIDLPLGTEVLRLGPCPIPRLQPIHQLEFAGLDEHRLGFREIWLVVLLGDLMLCAANSTVSVSQPFERDVASARSQIPQCI